MSTDWVGTTVCGKYEALLEDYLSGALDAGDSTAVEQHLSACAGCRRAFDHAAGSVRLLRLAAPLEGPGPAFARTVMARIRAAEEQVADRMGVWQPLVRYGWRFAATATLVLGVLVTYDAGWVRPAQRGLNDSRVTAVNDIFAPDPGKAPASRDEVLMMEAEVTHGN